jgi:carboxyl-terminal processing protease
MKKITFTLILLAVLSSCYFAEAQVNPCKQTPLLIGMLNKYHYSPVVLNQATSEEIFNDFIKRLDPDNTIFTSTDIRQLMPYKTLLLNTSSDEQICAFLKTVSGLYLTRLHRTDSLINTILQKPFDFTVKDSITFVHDYQASFATDDKELEKRWARKLKYSVLDILFTPVGEDDPLTMDAKQLLLKEEASRKKLRIKEKRIFQRILDYPSGYEAFVAEQFYNTIANRYDPHTLYFSPAGKESFRAAISREAKAFGLSFKEGRSGEVEIGGLTPGGPAWKSNQLNQGDIMVQVKWPKGEVLDLSCSSGEEVDQIINNSGYDNMRLTVKKTNGFVTTVPLVKEMINVEKNIIAGYILKGEKKIGYISLPGFYTEENMQNAPGCANDVAKEIFKLQKENIEGLILDLRFNGGGSLLEAIGLMGIFIDEGPLFMTKGRDQKPILMKDMNRGMAYGGPLILMVNGFSASASELVTAGLRDYNRALIVGSNTYGKAIAQVTLPLDTTLKLSRAVPDKKSCAYVNITIEKLYRINGESLQKTGIAPDIALPDLYNNMDYGEASEPYAINSDRVEKKVYYNPLPALPVGALLQKSKERTGQANIFKKIRNLSDSIQNARKQKEVLLLNIEAFREHEKKINNLQSLLMQLFKVSSTQYSVLCTHYDESVLQADSYRREMNDVLLKKIKEDVYIEEAYLIMNDLINLTKK